MLDRGAIDGIDRKTALNNYVKAAGKGVLKVMSKMGISTLASYTGAQLFQAVGISEEVLDEFFHRADVPHRGITLDDIAADVATRHQLAHLDRPDERAHRELEVGGGIPVAPGGRVPPVQPGDRVQAASTPRAPVSTRSSRSTPASSTTRASGWLRCAAC